MKRFFLATLFLAYPILGFSAGPYDNLDGANQASSTPRCKPLSGLNALEQLTDCARVSNVFIGPYLHLSLHETKLTSNERKLLEFSEKTRHSYTLSSSELGRSLEDPVFRQAWETGTWEGFFGILEKDYRSKNNFYKEPVEAQLSLGVVYFTPPLTLRHVSRLVFLVTKPHFTISPDFKLPDLKSLSAETIKNSLSCHDFLEKCATCLPHPITCTINDAPFVPTCFLTMLDFSDDQIFSSQWPCFAYAGPYIGWQNILSTFPNTAHVGRPIGFFTHNMKEINPWNVPEDAFDTYQVHFYPQEESDPPQNANAQTMPSANATLGLLDLPNELLLSIVQDHFSSWECLPLILTCKRLQDIVYTANLWPNIAVEDFPFRPKTEGSNDVPTFWQIMSMPLPFILCAFDEKQDYAGSKECIEELHINEIFSQNPNSPQKIAFWSINLTFTEKGCADPFVKLGPVFIKNPITEEEQKQYKKLKRLDTLYKGLRSVDTDDATQKYEKILFDTALFALQKDLNRIKRQSQDRCVDTKSFEDDGAEGNPATKAEKTDMQASSSQKPKNDPSIQPANLA